MIYEVFNQDSKYYRQMMDVIVAAKVNPPKQGQVHHIVPRCWFKHYNLEIDNSISNTVLLTWEDHKLVHNLAYKCAKDKWFKSKLACAAHFFGDTEPVIDLSGSNNPMYGKHLSEETKRKISEALKGKPSGMKGKRATEETKRKQSEAHKSENLSEETRAKLRKAAANNRRNLGNKHTEETKKQIGNSMKKYLWYTDGKVNIRSDKVLPAPFYRGRTKPF